MEEDDATSRTSSCDQEPSNLDLESGKLVEEEAKETGVVKLGIYQSYWKAVGKCLAPSVLLSLFFMQGKVVFCLHIFYETVILYTTYTVSIAELELLKI